MRQKGHDLLAVVLLAALAVAVGLVSHGSHPVLIALSLPLVFFLPGYALLAAALPDRRPGRAEVIALSMGLSIALGVLGGLVLNYLPSGFTANAWRLLLLAVITIGAGVALWRRGRASLGEPAPAFTATAVPAATAYRLSTRDAVWLSAAAVLLTVAFGVSAIGYGPFDPSQYAFEPFSQFWALADRGLAGEEGTGDVIRLGLQNHEGARMAYHITVEAGDYVLAEWPSVTLSPGGVWQVEVSVPQSVIQDEIVAKLYRASDPQDEPYRRVRVRPAANP